MERNMAIGPGARAFHFVANRHLLTGAKKNIASQFLRASGKTSLANFLQKSATKNVIKGAVAHIVAAKPGARAIVASKPLVARSLFRVR
jgi:hypothetical protein